MADRYASLKQGLVGCWIPSVSGSGLLLPDLSGRGNNGALTNMDASDWVSSQYGRALDFDGSNDRVESRAISYQSLPLTVAAWVKPNTVSGAQMLASHYGVEGNRAWYLALVNDTARILVSPDGTLFPYGQGGTVTTDWTHVVGVVGPSAFQIYLNGIAVSTTLTGTYPTQIFNSTANVVLGDRATIDTPLNGQLDDVRIYNRALTESEIKLLASKRGIGLEPRKPKITFADLGVQKTYSVVRVKETDYATLRQGLVGAWCPSLPNGGSGNTLPDVSGYGNHGTLTNMSPDDWVSSQYGRALDFDGSDDRVDITNESNFDFERTAQFSVTFWARLNTLSPTAQVVASKLDPVAPNTGWEVRFFSPFPGVDSNAINLILANNVSGGNFLMCSAAVGSLSVNQWYHVGVTYSGSSAASGVSLFLSGQRLSVTVNTDTLTASILNDLQLRIGQRANSSNTFPLSGQLDDIRIYNRALTESEICLLASKRGIGLQPSPTRFIAREKKTGLRRKILTGQT